MQRDNLIGTWRLERWVEVDSRGGEYYPQGEKMSGLLTYTDSGYTVVLSGVEPHHIKRLSNRETTHDHDHRLELFSSIISHEGECLFDKGMVTYIIGSSNHHHWHGTRHRRHFRLLDDNRLQTSTPPFVKDGVRYVSNMLWVREPRS